MIPVQLIVWFPCYYVILCAKECPVEEELVKIWGFWAAEIVHLNSLKKGSRSK